MRRMLRAILEVKSRVVSRLTGWQNHITHFATHFASPMRKTPSTARLARTSLGIIIKDTRAPCVAVRDAHTTYNHEIESQSDAKERSNTISALLLQIEMLTYCMGAPTLTPPSMCFMVCCTCFHIWFYRSAYFDNTTTPDTLALLLSMYRGLYSSYT